MKKLKYISVLLFVATTIFSQSLAGYKICIDPGHGGHDAANDRHVLPPDFWESESNYGKALHLKEILTELGATVIVTRSGNDDSDDLALSERAGIANANNVDYFHSIHSNATGTSSRVNFPLMLYRGYSNQPVYPESKTFASTLWNRLYESRSGVWTHSNERIYGDWTFYDWGTSGLGVLRPLSMPGTLSEGSFHDYIPEAWRLKNTSYQRNEAWAIARAFLDHYKAGKLTTGIIAGIIRDPDKNVPASYAPQAGTKDQKAPINFIKVTLNPGNRVYIGDDQNNGYYFFDKVEPGEYNLLFEEEFHSTESATVTVVAHKSVFVDKNLTEIPNYNAPVITSTFPLDQSVEQSTRDTVEVQFDIRMDQNSTESAFNISPSVQGDFLWDKERKTLMFFPAVPFEQQTLYTVTIKNTAKTSYNINLTDAYTFSFTTGVAPDAHAISSNPANGTEGISNKAKIIIEFDSPMNTVTTEQAFSIDPAAEGTFTWSDNNTKMHFTPKKSYVAGVLHTVTISTNAKTYFGGFLAEEFKFTFTPRAKLEMLSSYPENGLEGISTTVVIKMQFEMPILSTSLPGNIMFYDENNRFVDIVVNTNLYTNGIIQFEPKKALETNKNYRVILKPGITDVENVPFGEDLTIGFRTINTVYEPGQVIDSFEVAENWLAPTWSPGSVGIDADYTAFELKSTKVISGSTAGELKYKFTGSEGVCDVQFVDPAPVNNSANFGIWVFGDLSYNELEFVFGDGFETKHVSLGTIDWTGWQMKSIDPSVVGLSEMAMFNGFAIKQNAEADKVGLLYFDDAQTGFITDIKADLSTMPLTFSLSQNYPNPFNPTTNIKYQVAKSGHVNLSVYNMLGEEVMNLVDQEQNPGVYQIKFDGSRLASGIYIYRLAVHGFTDVKKLMLVK